MKSILQAITLETEKPGTKAETDGSSSSAKESQMSASESSALQSVESKHINLV